MPGRPDDAPASAHLPEGESAPVRPTTAAAAVPDAVTESGRLRRYVTAHPGLIDALVVLWYLAPAAATIMWPVADRTTAERLIAAAVMVLAGALLAVRRRVPLAVVGGVTVLLAVSTVLTGDLATVDFAAVLALYAVAAHCRAARAWVCLLVAYAVSVLSTYVWLEGHPETAAAALAGGNGVQLLLVETTTLLVLGIVAVALGVAARGRRLYLRALEDRTRQLALERDQREHLAVATERARIAREMHDVVAHSLSVMVALADGAGAALDRRPEDARHALQELAGTGRAALEDTRRLVGVLREDEEGGPPAPLSPQPGAPQITELVTQFQAAGLPVRLTERGPALPDQPGLQRAAYRILQESLTNVLRYARLSPRIDVLLDRRPDAVVIQVENVTGPAATATAGGGQGLIGMRERAAVHNGYVEAGPTVDGWRVRAILRWEEES